MRPMTHAPYKIVLILIAAAFVANPEPAMPAAEDTTATEPETKTAPAQAENSDDSDATLELSLRSAVNLAIENNLGVEVARHAPLIAEQDMSIAWSAYDPTFSADLTYAKVQGQSTGTFNSADPDSFSTAGKTSITSLVPYTGATLSLEYAGGKSKSPGGIETYKPKVESGLSLSANIPLLRNLVWNDPWTRIEISTVLHSSTMQEFRTVIMDTVRDTVTAYWVLVAEEEQLRVAKKSLETGIALLEQTQVQYEVGVKAKVEVIQAEAGVAARELDVIRADARYQNSQDDLINAVFGVRLRPRTTLWIHPSDSPLDFEHFKVDPKRATELALKNRPEVQALELDIERQEVEVRFRKNQRLPQLDMNLTYGTSAVGGKGNPNPLFPGPPPPDNGWYSDTHDDWFSKRGTREYSVGGMFTIPLGNSGARHNVTKARLELRRAKTRLTQLHQQIIVEIRRDIRLFEAARKGIDASERQRVAAEEQLRAEKIRLEHGESTPFDVLQKESELVEAEVSKINALQLYQTSASNLDRAQGTILRTHNIVVGSASGLRNGFEKESFAIDKLFEPILP